MTLPWPHALWPRKCDFTKSSASRTGGRSLTGKQQTTRSDAGFWRAVLQIPVHGEDGILAYRALYAALDGMATDVLVPCISRFRPRDANGAMLSAARMTGPHLFNHLGFRLTEPEIAFADAAPMGSTRLTVRHPNVPPLRAGHFFGIGDRVYSISASWQLDYERAETSGGTLTFGGQDLTFGGQPLTFGSSAVRRSGENVQVIEFWPKLRAAVEQGTPLILGAPLCRMKMASDETGALELDETDSALVVIEFEESSDVL